MKNAIIISLLLHLGFLGFLYVDFTSKPKPADNVPLIVDFMAVGSQSKAPLLAPLSQKKGTAKTAKLPESKKEEPKPEESKPQTPTMPAADTKTTPQVKSAGETETNHPKVETKEEPEAKVKPEPKPDSKPQVKSDAKSAKKPAVEKAPVKPQDKKSSLKPTTKVTPKPDAKTDPKTELKADKNTKSAVKKKATTQSQLVNLNPKKQTTTQALQKTLDNVLEGDDGMDGAPADAVGDVLTVTEVQAVVATLKQCWFVPAGTQGVLNTPVDITLHMNPDGSVREAIIEDTKRLATDPVFRTAAESAKRAALDPNCNPLPLPKERYEHWKKLLIDFNPTTMSGISGGIR